MKQIFCDRIYLLCMMPLMFCCDFWRGLPANRNEKHWHTSTQTKAENSFAGEKRFSWRFNEKIPDFVLGINFPYATNHRDVEACDGNVTGSSSKRVKCFRRVLNESCDVIYERIQHPSADKFMCQLFSECGIVQWLFIHGTTGLQCRTMARQIERERG